MRSLVPDRVAPASALPTPDHHNLASALLSEATFQSCSPAELARFLPYVKERSLQPGEVLQQEERPAAEMFLILEGAFEIIEKDGQIITIQNGFLGEEAAIGLDRYGATIKASTPAKVLVMPAKAISKLAEQPALKSRLLASFGGRLNPDTNETGTRHHTASNKSKDSPRLFLGWLVALCAPLLLFWYFHASDSLPNTQALYLLCTLSSAISMWVFRLLPDFVPALFLVLSIILTGVAPPDIALGGFASDSFFMALSILGLSAVITFSGLSFRALLWLLQLGPAHKAWYNFSLFITGTALTPMVPTTNGRIAIVSPFMSDLLRAFKPADAKAEASRLAGSVVGGVSLLSAVFLSSKSVNFVIFGMLPFQEQFRFQWLYWLYAASLCGAILMALYFLGLWLLFRNKSNPSISKSLVLQQKRILGPITPPEWACMFGLGVLFASFLTTGLHGIEIPWVALAIVMSLLIFGFLGKKAFREKIDWSFLIFLGALIGVVRAMRYVELDDWLSQQISWLGTYMENEFNLFILVLAATIFVIRLALPINATVIIFATLLIPTAINIGVNPWVVGFIILLLAENFLWPYQASYYTMFVSLVGPQGRADDRKLVILNFLTFGFKLIAIYASIPFWQYLGLL
ncbi:SLC13 family permease [Terasakiella sp. SH-1]|uniref:SLC13 family permease n=1 Tax=Terasakiella sp. SH-1 TaxID=2560057 RepID=UPI0010747F25|nr:SLC13 family permease [Terasakiella sp. SH-1]